MTVNTSPSACLAHPLQASGRSAPQNLCHVASPRSGAGLWSWLWARLERSRGLARQRQALLELDETLLRDIGLTREQALREAGRPIWDAPRHWRG